MLKACILKAAFTRQTKVGKLVLENFKKLANSCLDTSNSRQITHTLKFVTWPLMSWSYFMLIAGEETESAGKIESRIWMKPYISRNPSLGAYSHSCIIFVCLFFVSLYAGDDMSHKSGQL